METVLNIIMNPIKAFNQLKAENKFPVITFIILLTLVLIHLILNVPIGSKVSELLFLNMSLPENQMDMIIQMTHKMRYFSILSGLVMYGIMLFIYTAILYLIALVFREKYDYSKTLRLIISCSIILVIGDLVNDILVYYKGIDNIESMYSVMLTGANLLTSVENAGIAIYLFLSYINPFQIWFVFLLILGFKILMDSNWVKSSIICIIYWLIVTLFPVISTYLSQVTLANKGII